MIAFLDVGQGDAIFIESPTGVQILVDGGPGRSTLRALGSVMPFYDRSIDALLVTNPDQDHFAGFLDVLERYRVSQIFEPGTEKNSEAYQDFQRHVEAEAAEHLIARRGQVLDLGGGAYLRVLFPDRDVSGFDTNTGSVVAQLIYGETEVLLMGDAPEAIEKYIVSLDGGALKSDILKIGHHGSKTSTSNELLGLAAPSVAIASLGADNRYGHPHAEVVERLQKFEIPFLRTDEEGTVVYRSNGKIFKRVD